MFIKPAQKLKRILRVHLILERRETEDIFKVVGGMYPPKPANSSSVVNSPKLTSFFKQISFGYAGEALPFETVPSITNSVEETDQQLRRARRHPTASAQNP